MQTSRTRILAISGVTLALIVAATAAVSAHPGDRDDGGFFGRGGFGGGFERGGLFGLRDELRMGIAGEIDQLVRRETTYETDEGLVTQRVDSGTASAVSETSLDYTLADGQTAAVAVDDDTQVVAFSEQMIEVGRRGIARQRLVGEMVTLADVEVGSEIVVWAHSEDDGSFLAQRIIVQPDTDADAESTDESADAAEDPATEDATTSTVADA